jgi:imidazolonepropionase-like amidohydrolase
MPNLLFLNATLIDGHGDIRERGALVVEDGRIAGVGHTTALESHRRGDDVRVIDLQGLTLMPGLIDSHIHFAGGDFVPHREAESVGLAALRTAEAATRTLMAGVTTVRAAGSRDFLDIDVRDAINAGVLVGPRVLASGRGITTTGGHYHNWCAVEADGVDAVRHHVRDHIKRSVDSIKLMLSPGIATQGADVNSEQFSLEEVRAAVYEAHKAGRRVLGHAIGLGGIRNGVAAGVDSIDHGFFLDEEQAVQMKAKGIYLVPTFSPTYYYLERRQAEPWRIERARTVEAVHDRAFRMALELGVPIAMGSDCGAQSRMPNGENALELELMVRHGMDPMAAIVAGTREAARLVGLPDTVGTLEPGKVADLFVVEGNPLDDIARVRTGVRMVVQAGTVRRDDAELARAPANRPTPGRAQRKAGSTS